MRQFLAAACLVALAAVPAARAQGAQLSHAQAQEQVERLLVASPYKLSFQARNGHIRYRLAFDRDDAGRASQRPVRLPETGEQHVTATGDAFELDICGDCGHEAARVSGGAGVALACHGRMRAGSMRELSSARGEGDT